MKQKTEKNAVKIIGILAISTVLIFSLFLVSALHPDDLQKLEEAKAGITPDSTFYGIDNAIDRISLLISMNKAEKALEISNERLAEVKEMIEKNKLEEVKEAEQGHDFFMQKAEDNLNKLSEDKVEDSEDISLIQKETENHQLKLSVLEDFTFEKDSPEETRNILENMRVRTEALENKAEEKKEKIKIKSRDSGISEIEIENEIERLEDSTGLKEAREIRIEREIRATEDRLEKLKAILDGKSIEGIDVSGLIKDLSLSEEAVREARIRLKDGRIKEARILIMPVKNFSAIAFEAENITNQFKTVVKIEGITLSGEAQDSLNKLLSSFENLTSFTDLRLKIERDNGKFKIEERTDGTITLQQREIWNSLKKTVTDTLNSVSGEFDAEIRIKRELELRRAFEIEIEDEIAIGNVSNLKLTKEQAVEIAKGVISGTLKEVELEIEDGRIEWKVRIITPDGRRADIRIDDATGSVTRQRIENEIEIRSSDDDSDNDSSGRNRGSGRSGGADDNPSSSDLSEDSNDDSSSSGSSGGY